MTTVHHLTNGEDNWSFRISGDQAIVTHTSPYSCEARIVTTTEARNDYKMVKKFNVNVRSGFTPLPAERKLTTWAQYDAWAAQQFDFKNNDNDAEAELAMSEQFREVGYLEVFHAR